mgnify:CR=1 FL=1
MLGFVHMQNKLYPLRSRVFFSYGTMEKELLEQYENIGGVILKDLGLSYRKTIGSYEVKSIMLFSRRGVSCELV